MRALISRVNSSKRACSSGVIFRGLFLFAIVSVRQQPSDLVDILADAAEHSHYRRGITVVDRYEAIVAAASSCCN
jgi:hypothetical protein